MGIFDKFFCYYDLCYGSVIIGVMGIVECVTNEFLYLKQFIQDESCNSSRSHFFSNRRELFGSSKYVFLWEMIKLLPIFMTNIVGILVNVSLIVGATQATKILLLPWLVVAGVRIFMFLVTTNTELLLQATPVSGSISHLCFIATCMYTWLCVYSFYLKLQSSDEDKCYLPIEETGLQVLPLAPNVSPTAHRKLN